jgi:protein ImuA
MILPAQKLARLRASVALLEAVEGTAKPRVSLGHKAADAALAGGIALGALHEVFAGGVGDTGASSGFALALALCAGRARPGLLWIRQDFSALEAGEISATGLLELGLDPDRLLLVRVADAAGLLRAAAEGLTCAGLGALILEFHGESRLFDLALSRRLTLAAQRQNVTAIFLRHGAEPEASAAETRWLIRAAASPAHTEDWGKPVFDAQLTRNRHGRTGQWIMEWNADDICFRDRGAAHPRAVAAAVACRTAATADAHRRYG